MERRKQEEIRQKEQEELMKKLIEEIKDQNDEKENNSSFLRKEINASESREMSQMIDLDSFFPSRDIYTYPETFEEKVQRLMAININKDLQLNLYARIRIEEHLKDILKIREDVGTLFNA